jgi:hypothetical protein
MGLGVSLILIAVGAILTWAVHAHVNGLDVTAVGVILMIVGLVSFLLSLAFWSSWWGPGYFRRYSTATGPASGPVRRRRRVPATYVEEPAEVEEIVEERY